MPALLHSRAAAMASSSVSPATKRRAMRRVVPLEVTHLAKPLLSESLSSVDRSMRELLWQCKQDETSLCVLPETFRHQWRPCHQSTRRRTPGDNEGPPRRPPLTTR